MSTLVNKFIGTSNNPSCPRHAHVMPAQAGNQFHVFCWIPGFAGMTKDGFSPAIGSILAAPATLPNRR